MLRRINNANIKKNLTGRGIWSVLRHNTVKSVIAGAGNGSDGKQKGALLLNFENHDDVSQISAGAQVDFTRSN
jgi:hypothetical protein